MGKERVIDTLTSEETCPQVKGHGVNHQVNKILQEGIVKSMKYKNRTSTSKRHDDMDS